MFLATTSSTLELKLAGAITTNQLPYWIDWADTVTATASATGPFSSSGATNSTTAVTALAAPASGVTRQVLFLSVFNSDTAVATLTVQLNDGSATRISAKVTLAIGDGLGYSPARGFYCLDSAGNVKSNNALSIDTSALTSGTLPVARGGTGDASLTTYAVLCGGTTSTGAVQPVASVGTSGQVLTSNGAAALPTFQTGLTAAAQSDQETATSNVLAVTPGRQQFHPSSPKFWVIFDGAAAGTIKASYNVSSITRNATGNYTITFTVPFSSGDYCVQSFVRYAEDNASAAAGAVCEIGRTTGGMATGSVRIFTYGSATGAMIDVNRVCVTGWGDQ